MKLKKITLTTGIFPPDIGGPASFIPTFAEFLVQNGIEVDVITLSDKIQDYKNLTYKVIAISRKIKKPFRDILVVKEIIKSAKTSDLIFSNTLAFESAIASKISGKKLMQKIVGDLAWERANTTQRFKGSLDEYQKARLCLKSNLTNIYRNFAIKRSDFIITPSEYLKNIVKIWDYPTEKIEVIYNAALLQQSDKIIKKQKYRIVSVARLIPHKGFEAILKTLRKLNFDFEYIVIGDGFLKISLENLSKELKIDTKFIGNISKKEVADYLKNSDLFILNSSYEGMPHVVLEAMQNSCPVIASRVGGTPEVVKHNENGLLFKHNDIADLQKKIYSIKNDNILRDKLIKNAKLFTKEFANVDKMFNRYINAIEKLI